ncbi:MAG: RNA methyltransferase [Flavobacteriales bacterium]|nr:RNA methyltransferase [Flavobacteriales bacterium]
MRKLKNDELNRKTIREYKEAKKHPIVVVLNNIRSLSNVGSIFRTSDCFIVESLYLCGITPTPPNREIQKTALGATESVNWVYEKECAIAITRLKEDGYQIISIEQTDISVSLENFELDPNSKYAIVMGNEVDGVDSDIIELSDTVIELPLFGTKHSFNVSICTGMVLWELVRQFRYHLSS